MYSYFIFGFLLMLSAWETLAQQPVSGIFLTEENNPYCKLSNTFINEDKELCLLEEPVVHAQDFAAVTNINFNLATNSHALVLTLSEAGKAKLSTLTQLFPGKILAVVVNGQIVSAIRLEKSMSVGEILLYEKDENEVLEWLRPRLQEIVRENRMRQEF